jgi:hypothetical protein
MHRRTFHSLLLAFSFFLLMSPHYEHTVLAATSTPTVSLNATKVSFGSQAVGTSSAANTVTLKNTGTGALTLTSIALGGANPTAFLESNTCGATVSPGASCVISVNLRPPSPGSRTASVLITDNAAGSPHSIALTGTGTGPAVSLSPASLVFSSLATGSTSPAQALTLANSVTAAGVTSNAPLVISSIALTGANASAFRLTNACGSSLGVGSSCALHVSFAPSAVGQLAASLTITDNAYGSPHSVSLSGTGVVGEPAVSLSSTSLSMGTQTVGTSSSAHTVTLKNTGTAALTLTSIALGGANPTVFLESNTCGATVSPGASCVISVNLRPPSPGSRTASVLITDNAAGSPHSIALTGTGTGPAVSFSPVSLVFSSLAVGSKSSAQTLTLANSSAAAGVTSNAPLVIGSIALTGSNASAFRLTNACSSSLGVGSSCALHVSFAPSTAALLSASLTVTDNAYGSPHSVSLSGTGVGTPAASLSPTSLSFGSQTVGTSSSPQGVTLTNSGNGALTVSSIAVTGANPGAFTLGNGCGTSLNPIASCTISVSFAPTASGSMSATVAIIDSAANSPQAVALTGTAAPAAAPTITTQPSSQGVPAGQWATFTVSAQSPSTPTYQWYKGSAAIANAQSASYTIQYVAAGDAGNYSVAVTNSGGSITSSAAQLTVGPPDLTVWPNASSQANSDPWISQHHTTIRKMQPRFLVINFANGIGPGTWGGDYVVSPFTTSQIQGEATAFLAALKEASRYQPANTPSAPAFLDPQLAEIVNLQDNSSHANSGYFPRGPLNPNGYPEVGYYQLFTQAYAPYWGYMENGQYLTLGQILQRGYIHEIIMMANQVDGVPANPPDQVTNDILEVAFVAQAYDANRNPIPGAYVRNGVHHDRQTADMSQATGIDDNSMLWTGRSARIYFLNVARGNGCLLHSLAHEWEFRYSVSQIYAPGQSYDTASSNPYMAPIFTRYDDFDMDTKYGVSFNSLYAGGNSYTYTTCGNNGARTTLNAPLANTPASINNYTAVAGNCHYPPGASQGYDYYPSSTVMSSMETFGQVGETPVPFNFSHWAYVNTDDDCGGRWLTFWYQNFPGLDNNAFDPQGNPMLNWWPFMYY